MANFTQEQQHIIDSRNKNLIVSAAAGSGKTTVMIERIKELVVKDKVPISNFLVVTFTKASATDMKARLMSKLSSLEPTPFILEQIDNVSTADVSNLHSFCARLLKSYFYEAGLDPTFVVLSDTEVDLLKQKALNKLFDEEFENNNSDFYMLVDSLQKNRSDKALKDNILKLYNFFNVIFDRETWFNDCISSGYNCNLSKNRACNIINGYVCSRVNKLLEEVSFKIVEYNNLGLTEFVAYLQDIQSELSKISHRNNFLKNSKIVYETKTFLACPKCEEAFADYRNELELFRKYVNEEIKNFKANYISDDEQTIVSELEKSKILATELYNATNKFEKIYTKLKTEKCGLDYNDLEQYTLKVLENVDILESLKQKYKYVFVDEYQDINAVQEKIISLLSGTDNRFMVGDIKQSIYRFRLCDPDIFLNKYHSYKTEHFSESVDLSKNFRSNQHILDFVNLVFNDRMTEEFGGVNYKETSQLVCGAPFNQEDPVTLCYIDSDELTKQKKNFGKVEIGKVYSVKNHEQEDELENLLSKAESEYIASEILELVANKTIYDSKQGNDRSIRFRDIAIMIPARNEYLDSLLEVFANYKIPASTDAMVNVLTDEYVKCIYNYLKIIYNYKQDIELFSVLYSPLSDFTLNELAELRFLEKDCRFFYQSIEKSLNNDQLNANIKQKLQKFIQKLNYYKQLSGYKTVKQVVLKIIEDYNIKNLIYMQADGKQRIALLDKFIDSLPTSNVYEYFADGVLVNINAEKSSDTDAVSIVTIHKSKGLEYPVAFLANAAKGFNKESVYGDVLINKELGLAINFFDNKLRYKNTTVIKEAIKLTETRKLIEEQQRLLYVALTRGINKLYVVACKSFNKLNRIFPERQNSFSDWFDSFVYSYLQGENLKNICIKTLNAESLIKSAGEIAEPQVIFGSDADGLAYKITEAFTRNYEFVKQSQTSKKTSVTEIASGYHESEEYYQKYNETSSSSIEKGNAYHKFMQYINFDSNTIELLNKNIQELIYSGKISQEELSFINKNNIIKLINNQKFKDIINFGKVLREQEFFMNIGESDIQIVQGVVDLAIINDKQAIILDYKTGNFANPSSLSKYKKQIELYAMAIEKSFDVKVIKFGICAIEEGEIYFL